MTFYDLLPGFVIIALFMASVCFVLHLHSKALHDLHAVLSILSARLPDASHGPACTCPTCQFAAAYRARLDREMDSALAIGALSLLQFLTAALLLYLYITWS